MKKLIKSVVLIFVLATFGTSAYLYIYTDNLVAKRTNEKNLLVSERDNLKQEVEEKEKSQEDIKEELNQIKDTEAKNIEEYEIWENLEKELSSYLN